MISSKGTPFQLPGARKGRPPVRRSRSGKIKALQENAKLLAFLQGNGINSMQELYEKVSAMNKDYYDLRGQGQGKSSANFKVTFI